MDDGFFEFLARKIDGDGIYVRLVNATGSVSMDEAVFDLEYGKSSEKFRTKDTENVLVFEFADFGVKIKGEVKDDDDDDDNNLSYTIFEGKPNKAMADGGLWLRQLK